MFEMDVEDIFSITGRGTVFTGKVRSGSIAIGDSVVCKTSLAEVHTRVIGLHDHAGRSLETIEEGATIGVVCKTINHQDLRGAFEGEGETARVVSGVTLKLGPKKRWWQF
jgi:translation elongation factor EF-Tu-like GTPase